MVYNYSKVNNNSKHALLSHPNFKCLFDIYELLPLTILLFILLLFLFPQADVFEDLSSVAERAMAVSTLQPRHPVMALV